MLDLERVDLIDLAVALEDHSNEHTWWFDPDGGDVSPRFAGTPDERPAGAAGQRLIAVEPLPITVGYGDMEDFIAQLRDPSARRLLARTITGRGAFRRFKDALLDHPELRRSWFAFHDARGELRAIEWLVERRLVDPVAARDPAWQPESGLAALPGMLDAERVAARAARDLRRLYRDRLRRVLLIGAWARGDAHADDALELLVVLDAVLDRWQEKARMDRVMWRHSLRNDTVLTETPVAEAEFARAATPLLARAAAEGVRVG